MTPRRARQTISDLIALIGSSDLADVELTDGDLHLRLRRSRPRSTAARPFGESNAADSVPAAEPAPRVVHSALVGRFYRTRPNEADPLVHDGEVISPGQTVAFIEAMNLFNEVTSEHGGRVARILVHDGDRVEYGQPLMELE
jgi:acetyl-CoA carboxylase biotin carboxyl carrier protein